MDFVLVVGGKLSVKLGVAHHLPQSCRLRLVLGRPFLALTISFTKKEGLKPTFKRREGVCPPDLNWELVPEKRRLIAEGSAPQTHF